MSATRIDAVARIGRIRSKITRNFAHALLTAAETHARYPVPPVHMTDAAYDSAWNAVRAYIDAIPRCPNCGEAPASPSSNLCGRHLLGRNP